MDVDNWDPDLIKTFEKHIAETLDRPQANSNICESCHEEMILQNCNELVCPQCKNIIRDNIQEKLEVSGDISSRNLYRAPDKQEAQYKDIWSVLAPLMNDPNKRVQFEAWTKVIASYNLLQQNVRVEVLNENGEIIYKPYVKRDPLRRGILGALLGYILLNDYNTVVTPETISKLMDIDRERLTRGKQEIDNLIMQGYLPPRKSINADSIATTTREYLKNLMIDKKFHEPFIRFTINIIETSERHNICTTITYPTKINGCICIINTELGLGKTNEDIKRATNVAKSTSTQFIKDVQSQKNDCFKVYFDELLSIKKLKDGNKQ